MTREQQARNDLMILYLKQAVECGYSMVTPGSNDAVREAFPDLFATDAEKATIDTDEDLEMDDHPLVSRADDHCGYWVGTWSWTYTSQDASEGGS